MLPALSSLYTSPRFSGILSQNSHVYAPNGELMDMQTKTTFERQFEPIAQQSGQEWQLVSTADANNFGGWAYLCDDETGNHLTFYKQCREIIETLRPLSQQLQHLLPEHHSKPLGVTQVMKDLQDKLDQFIQSGVGEITPNASPLEKEYMTWDEYRASFKPQT